MERLEPSKKHLKFEQTELKLVWSFRD